IASATLPWSCPQRPSRQALSRWIWVSTKPGKASLPPTSISAASQVRRGSMAAMRPPAMPISTGVVEARVRALRKMRSKAVLVFIAERVGGALNLADQRFRGSSRLCAVLWSDCSKYVHAVWRTDCRVRRSGESAMSIAAEAQSGKDPKRMSDAEVVEAYLTASMIPDPDAAAAYMKPGTIITFTGGREFDHPRGPTGFNARRYRWVKKKMDRFDVCPGADETVVYSIGTLYGEWIDGTPFEGNRYVDRFVVKGGQIVKMDVWNDSAERILVQRGIEA